MNIAEILRGCPSGTRLYSPIYGELSLVNVQLGFNEPICCRVVRSGNVVDFAEDGKCNKTDAEPTLFPSKTQRDWSKFRLPVKRGDIMMDINGEFPFIATGKLSDTNSPKYICGINSLGKFQFNLFNGGWTPNFYIPASEEAKKDLFDKMKEAGYKWNADTLKLEKIEPKFKEGDVLINKDNNALFLFTGIVINDTIQGYVLSADNTLLVASSFPISLLELASIEDRNKLFSIMKKGYEYDKKQHKLVKQEFKPFDKVLVRDYNYENWKCSLFSHYQNSNETEYIYATMNGSYIHCIPYKGNEYLLNKTDNPQ